MCKPLQEMVLSPSGTLNLPHQAALCKWRWMHLLSFKEAYPFLLFQNLKHLGIEAIKYTHFQHSEPNPDFCTANPFKVKIRFPQVYYKLDLANPSPISIFFFFLAISKNGVYLTCILYGPFVISNEKDDAASFSLPLYTNPKSTLAFGWYSGIIMRNLA